MYNVEESLFEAPSNKFKLQCNETIKSLQFCKLVMQHNKNVEEWMGRLRIAAIKCNYTEIDTQLKEHYTQTNGQGHGFWNN